MICNYIFYMKAIKPYDTMAPPDCIISLEGINIGKSCITIATSTYIHVQNANM